MKLKLITFLMVFSMLFIACDDTKPKADTYTLSGELNGIIGGGDYTAYPNKAYIRIFNASKITEAVAPIPVTFCNDSDSVYSTSVQFPESSIIKYQVSGIPEGTYKACVYIDDDGDKTMSDGDFYHLIESITINSNTIYNISNEDENSDNDWTYFSIAKK